jgi:hypothetical protein
MPKTGTMFRDIGKVIKWVLIVVGALLLVVFILQRMVVTTGNHSNERSSHVTPAKFAAIHTGMTIAQVESLIGAKPESTQTTVISGTTNDCIYYGAISAKGTYQFCFTNTKLESKSKY